LGDLALGYREGRMKYIFNATYNNFEVYDLSRDRFEATDLSRQTSHDEMQSAKARLATWLQYQDQFIRSLTRPAAQSTKLSRETDSAVFR